MSNKKYPITTWVSILIIGLLGACQDPIIVGSDLLDEERLDIAVTDTFSLSSYTVSGEKVTTHNPGVNSKTYMLGQLDDVLFGKISAEIYLKCLATSTALPNYHLEKDAQFDSLILVLKYDSTATYANTSSLQKIEMYQLNDKYSDVDTFYSNTELGYNSTLLGEAISLIKPKDSINITDHVTRKIVRQAPQLRIKINDEFGKSLLANESASKNDTAFAAFFKGVYIKSSALDNKPFIYGFDFSNEALGLQTPINKLIMYYHVTSGDTTLRKTYEYQIDRATINRFVHERSGSQVEQFILNPTMGDSLMFLQGIGGVKSVIKFNDLDKLKNTLINKAEIELFVADIAGQNGTYTPPKQLIVSRLNSSGKLQLISDISQMVSAGVSFSTVFGGTLDSSGPVRKYTLNITNHIKTALKDPTINTDLHIGILTESEIPNRAVFFGAKHSQYPIRFKITYTKN